jgi:hypothetical protein
MFDFGRINKTNPIDKDYLRDTPWDVMLCRDWNADGNTKWGGDKPTLAFIKNNLFLEKAAAEIGYACPRGNGKIHLAKRVRTNGVGKLLPLLRALIEVGKMPKDCSTLLKVRTKPARLAIEFANEIIEASVKKWGTREKALSKLRIDESLVRWWESRL